MKKRTKKGPNDYPRICIRIDGALLERVDAAKSKADLSYGQIISQALRRYIPELEKFHAS